MESTLSFAFQLSANLYEGVESVLMVRVGRHPGLQTIAKLRVRCIYSGQFTSPPHGQPELARLYCAVRKFLFLDNYHKTV